MAGSVHDPVMVAEVLEYMQADRSGVFLDCTLGGGGHSEAILKAHPDNKVFAIDRDARAVARAVERLNPYADRFFATHAAFSELSNTFVNLRFNAIFADLGISSDQLSETRGFSFNDEGPLDMRMNEEADLSAANVVNEYAEGELFRLFKRGGVGKEARAVVAAIVRERPFTSTRELTECIHRVCGVRNKAGTRDSATVFFQAIRMEVNAELTEIESMLDFARKSIDAGGRLVVLGFHSLEDKLVARTMRSWAQGEEFSALWKGSAPKQKPIGDFITRKAVVPTRDEVASNPRSRSTRLRAFQFN